MTCLRRRVVLRFGLVLVLMGQKDSWTALQISPSLTGVGKTVAARSKLRLQVGSFVEEIGFDEDPLEPQEMLKGFVNELKRSTEHSRRTGHIPVQELSAVNRLLFDTVHGDKVNGTFVDGTFGRGGHSRSILNRLTADSQLFAFDVDPLAIAEARKLEAADPRFRIHHRPFADMATALAGVHVDGVLLDLGVSSPQQDSRESGFIRYDTPLDLRMNPEQGISAADWIENVSVEELSWVLREHAGFNSLKAERTAEAILLRRQRLGGRINLLGDVRDVVKDVAKDFDLMGDNGKKVRAGKDVVAGIRRFLNNEFQQLTLALNAALDLLEIGGRFVIITFTPPERQIIETFVQNWTEPSDAFQNLTETRLFELFPVVQQQHAIKKIEDHVTDREARSNGRSRSANMYTLVKVRRRCSKVRVPGSVQPRPMEERFKSSEPPPFFGS